MGQGARVMDMTLDPVFKRYFQMTNLPDQNDRILAVTTFDKNIVVTAGAGTGKTTLLVDRIIHLLMREPDPLKITEIVALTFTNKAANEMKLRLKGRLHSFEEDFLLGDIMERYRLGRDEITRRATEAINNLEKAQIGTIHSFAGHILRLYPVEAGIDPGFEEDDGSIFDEHFEREWEGWLDGELSSNPPDRDLWKGVLRRVTLESLRHFARELCRESIPVQSLEAAMAQDDQRLKLSRGLMRWLEDEANNANNILLQYTGLKEVKIKRLLRQAIDIFEGVISKSQIPIITDSIPSGRPPAGWPDKDYKEAQRIVRIAQRLSHADNAFFERLLKLLLPFVTLCREKFIFSGNISFDGLITSCRNLLKERPAVRGRLKRHFRAIMVDEFQDTDPVQYEIILYLGENPERNDEEWRSVRLTPGKMFIVGDPKQSIYAFRRADIEAYHHVVDLIVNDQGGLEADLITNFRSHQGIINAVNNLFRQMITPRDFFQPEYVDIVEYPGHKATRPAQRVELRLVDGREMDDIDASTATRLEAAALGKWLKEELLGREELIEPDGSRVAVSPRHIAILLRKLTDVNEYLEVLRRLDIPYIVEGERHFYTNQEIIDFVNLLRVIDNPSDILAFTGVLRSPLGGLSDREIYEINRLSLLDYRITGERMKEGLSRSSGLNGLDTILTELYGILKGLNSEVKKMPVPDAINFIFDNTPLLELAASSYQGEQAVANLRKISKIAESLSDRGNITVKGFAALLEKKVTGAAEEGESLLSEEGVDAVRILSIHKAKGLEFPVVIAAGLHGTTRGGEDSVSVMYDWSSGEVGFKVGGLRNYSAVMLRDRARIREEEEQKRLLYVAMTRARECLILSGTLYNGANRGSFLSMINDAAGNGLGDRADDEIVIGDGVIKQTLIDYKECLFTGISGKGRRKGKDIVISDEEIEHLAALWESRTKRYQAIKDKRLFVTPSGIEEGLSRLSGLNGLSSKVEGDAAEVGYAARGRSILIGTLAHRVLEYWDFKSDISLLKNVIEDVCLRFMPEGFAEETLMSQRLTNDNENPLPFKGRDRPVLREVEGVGMGLFSEETSSVREELEKMFFFFVRSPAYEELKTVEIIGRETPFTIPWDGQIMDGVIDIIYKDGEGIYAADYKTDRLSEGDLADKIKEYASSGHIYREAVKRCLKIDVVGFKLIFLRLGRSKVVVRWDSPV